MAVRLKVYGSHHVHQDTLDGVARSVRGMLIERVPRQTIAVSESLQLAPGVISAQVVLVIKICPCLGEELEAGRLSLEREAGRLRALQGVECTVVVTTDPDLTDHDGHRDCA